MLISAGRVWSPEGLGRCELRKTLYDADLRLACSPRLDGYSRYAGREEAKEHRASRDGFGGIGVRIRLIEEGVLILSVMEKTPPPKQAGLLGQ